jgi:hypothetical protein
MPIPSDGTTFSQTLRKMVTQCELMGNAHAGSLRTRRRQYTNPMSKFVSPKTYQSNKSAKKFKILSEIRPDYRQMGSSGWYQEKDSGFTPLTHLYPLTLSWRRSTKTYKLRVIQLSDFYLRRHKTSCLRRKAGVTADFKDRGHSPPGRTGWATYCISVMVYIASLYQWAPLIEWSYTITTL